MEYEYWAFFFRWLHVLSGIMWIGLLWYFNFVQAPTMPKIPDDLKPAVGKYIAPEALFWFRWAALSTVATGLILAALNRYIGQALALGLTDNVSKHATIGFGMWIGVIMAANVWFIIWPKQQIALGLVEAEADAKPAAARMAMLASRTNTMLSIPMLYAMVSAQNL
ncbi:MAG: urate hydroxylase PuuD [Alphaproteobacteria bacterium]|nr:urate hydroxylase PuuD [Alphaproteobacteria bacterium]